MTYHITLETSNVGEAGRVWEEEITTKVVIARIRVFILDGLEY